MGQIEYIIAIIVTIPLAFYLGKKIGKSYRNSAFFGIMTLGGWLWWTFAASIPFFIKQPQYSLIIVVFLICLIIIRMKKRKENLEKDNLTLKDKVSNATYEKEKYKEKYEEILKEKEELEQGTRDIKKRSLLKPILDIFKMLKK